MRMSRAQRHELSRQYVSATSRSTAQIRKGLIVSGDRTSVRGLAT